MSRILVIEDSSAIALLIKRRLEMAGHSVETLANGDLALKRLEDGELPELVVADVMMPGLDGLSTLRQIRDRHPGLPVILVTGQDLDEKQRQEADAVFAKPIEFDSLLATIRRLTSRPGAGAPN